MYEEISSKNNKFIKYVKKLYSSTKFRLSENCFVVEGRRLCEDAAKSGIQIEAILLTHDVILHQGELQTLLNLNARKIFISSEVVNFLADTKTSQGVFCVAKLKKSDESVTFDVKKDILLEHIQDPANLGAILRTAEAFGFDRVFVTSDCVDTYNPKVLRAAMGAVFRVDFVVVKDISKFIKNVQHNGVKVYAAVPDRLAVSVTKIGFGAKTIVVIGNEGNGISKDTLKLCDEKITLQMPGRAESLNAAIAAGIIMWEMKR